MFGFVSLEYLNYESFVCSQWTWNDPSERTPEEQGNVTWQHAQKGRHSLIDKLGFKAAVHSSAVKLPRFSTQERNPTRG